MPDASENRRDEGAAAFKAGRERTSNPHDADSEAWMSWMDGYDQAQGRAETGRDGDQEGGKPYKE